MKTVLCTNRRSIYETLFSFLKNEVDSFEVLTIKDELLDKIYLLNPDIIIFDLSERGNKKWKLIKKLTSAPSLREIPLIVIMPRKNESFIQKICEYEIFDYLVEKILKCELISKIHKAKQMIEINKELKQLITKDPLTGAYNRSFLMERIQEEIRWSLLYREPLSIALFDIDYFKKINDNYGHLTGDKILKEIVSLVAESLPNSFTLGRYGGEEFFILMPNTGEKEALRICDKLRKKVSKNQFHTYSGKKITLTISIGITTLNSENLVTMDELIQKADMALYKAKERGRNCVIYLSF